MIWLCTVETPQGPRVQYVQAPTAEEASRLLQVVGMTQVGLPVLAGYA